MKLPYGDGSTRKILPNYNMFWTLWTKFEENMMINSHRIWEIAIFRRFYMLTLLPTKVRGKKIISWCFYFKKWIVWFNQIWEIIQIQDKYNATMACVATYGVFVMLTKVSYLQFHEETLNVIWIHDFHLFNILFNFEAYVCQLFTMLMGMGLRCYITTYHNIWRWL
jgi:hypothetical protein